MKFNKETFLGIAICLLIMIAWGPFSNYMGWNSAEAEESQNTEETASAPAPVPAATPAPAAPAAKEEPKLPERTFADVVLGNSNVNITIAAADGEIKSIELLKYAADSGSGNVVVAARENGGGAFRISGKDWQNARVVDFTKEGNACTLTRLIRTPQGSFKLIQRFQLDETGYEVNCSYQFINAGKSSLSLTGMTVFGCELLPWSILAGDKIRAEGHRLDYLSAGNDFEEVDADAKDEKFFFKPAPQVRWAAVDNKYFCSVLKTKEEKPFTLIQRRSYLECPDRKDPVPAVSVSAALPDVTLEPGATTSREFRMYNGPKIIDNLQKFAPQAEKVRKLAWGPLDYLARFLLWVLELFNSIFHSYGWSIVALTILVRLVFYPITARGNESMKKMQKVQPMFKELREKYKDNPQLLNQKMTELYRKEGVNPFAGCLPILLQIPIFFALYQMLYNAIELRHESFLWCKNLAAADTVVHIPFLWNLAVNPLVIVMTALMVVQQHMTPMAVDSAQRKMMLAMPVVMLIFLYDLPSGLTLYWTVSNLFSIIQLWLQKRRGAKAEAAGKAN